MTYAITTTTAYNRTVEASGFETKEDAVRHAHARWTIVDLEHDAQNPDCADFFTACGQVMAIEPARA